jgi:hypothetical protein
LKGKRWDKSNYLFWIDGRLVEEERDMGVWREEEERDWDLGDVRG